MVCSYNEKMDNMQNDIQEFHTLHPNKKIQILGIIAVIFVVSIGLGLYIAGRTPSNAPTPDNTTTVQGATRLSIVPESIILAKGSSTKVNVVVEGEGSQATDVVITFDPTAVKASDIVNGTVFPDILRSDIGEKQLVVSAAVDPNNPNDLKTGTLFSFTLEGIAAGTSTLAFDKNVTITATNGVNTLGTVEAVSIKIQ